MKSKVEVRKIEIRIEERVTNEKRIYKKKELQKLNKKMDIQSEVKE